MHSWCKSKADQNCCVPVEGSLKDLVVSSLKFIKSVQKVNKRKMKHLTGPVMNLIKTFQLLGLCQLKQF